VICRLVFGDFSPIWTWRKPRRRRSEACTIALREISKTGRGQSTQNPRCSFARVMELSAPRTRLRAPRYIRPRASDIWNVNPIALRRIEKLFCSSTADPISFPAMYPSLKARRWVGFSMVNRHRLRAPRLQAVRERERRKRHPHRSIATAAAEATPLPMKPENAAK
jgi:hypothetical protein